MILRKHALCGRKHLVPDKIARIRDIVVRLVVAVCERALLQIIEYLPLADAQHGPYDLLVFGYEDASAYPARSRAGSAAEEIKKHAFRIVARVMGGKHEIRPVFRKDFAENAQPFGARTLFDPFPRKGGRFGHAHLVKKQGHARRRAQIAHEIGIGARTFAADPVFHVDGGNSNAVFARVRQKIIEQGDGIAPARQGDADALVAVRSKIDIHL